MKSTLPVAGWSELGFVLVAVALVDPWSFARAQAAEGKTPIKSDAATIKRLVDGLGSDEFAERESATEQLSRIGLPAFKAVEEASQHSDREVRYRAERILVRIRQLDLQRRLDAFLRGSEATDDYSLPGWTRFKKHFGDQPKSRAVFVDLTKADPELLQALESGPKNAVEVSANRVIQYQQLAALQQVPGQSSLQLSFGQVGALVFVSAEDDVTLNQTTSQAIFGLCNQQSMVEAATSAGRDEIPRKLLANLIVKSEDWGAYQAMALARRLNMKEGLIPAEKILKGNRQPHMAYYALATIASMGNDSHLPLIEKLFTDQNVVTQMHEKDKVIYKIEVRDAALAAALFLTKQDLKAYFPVREGQTIGDPQQVLTNPRIIGFADEAKRTETFKKWQDYRAKNPLPANEGKTPAKDGAQPAPAQEDKIGQAAPVADALKSQGITVNSIKAEADRNK
jgi:hypothetical protein